MRFATHILKITLFSFLLFSCVKPDIYERLDSGIVVSSLPKEDIVDFLFDKEGYVWMVPDYEKGLGLFKYDGANFIHYLNDPSNPTSLSSDKINDVFMDDEGIIWVASQKGVNRYNYETGGFDNIPLDDINAYVLKITESHDGRVCLLTRRNIMEYNESIGQFKKVADVIDMLAWTPYFFFDNDGFLWVRSDNQISCYDWKYSRVYNKPLSSNDLTLLYDDINHLYALSNGNLKSLNTTTRKIEPLPSIWDKIVKSGIENISLIEPGVLGVVAKDSNYLLDMNTGNVFPEGVGTDKNNLLLRSLELPSCKYDNAGGLWCARSGGGFDYYIGGKEDALNSSSFAKFARENTVISGCSHNSIHWFVTKNTLMTFNTEKGEIINEFDLSGYDLPSYLIVTYSNDHLLVSSRSTRARSNLYFKIDKSGIPKLEREIKVPTLTLMSLDREGNIIAGGFGTVVKKLDPKAKDLGNARELANPYHDDGSYCTALKELSDGRFLCCFTDNIPIILNPETGDYKICRSRELPQAYFSSVAEESNGDIWLGTTDKGLYHYDLYKNEMSHFDEYDGNTVYSLEVDVDDNVFILNDYKDIHVYNSSTKRLSHIWTEVSDTPDPQCIVRGVDGVVMLVGDDLIRFDKDFINSDTTIESPINVILSSGKQVIASFNTSSFPEGKVVIRIDNEPRDIAMNLALAGNQFASSTYSYIYDVNKYKTGPRTSFNRSNIPLYGLDRHNNTVRFKIAANNLLSETAPFTMVIRKPYVWYEILIPVMIVVLLLVLIIVLIRSHNRRLEVENERTKREMQEALNMKNVDLFANISHEFRTPLTLINGAVSMLSEDGSSTDLGKARGIIKRNADRMFKLVGQLMDLNKMDHDLLKLHVKMDSVTEIMESVKSNFEVGATIKNLDFKVNLPGNPIMGYLDRDKFEKIVYNLCSNAFKYTPPGGEVTVDVEVDDSSKLTISVTDTGIGMLEEEKDKVFERFYQGEGVSKSGGTGIGLSYAKSLVQLHHGEISLRSSQVATTDTPKGTTISFWIPLSGEEYSEEEKATKVDASVSVDKNYTLSEYTSDPQIEPSRTKPTVLIIDDDYEVVYYVKSLLSKTYNVLFRFDGLSGYNCLTENMPDVVICDIMMLEMDGIQFCSMVKSNVSTCHIPIVMLTAKSTVEDQVRSMEIGADAFLTKPFNPEYLMALIKSLLDNRKRLKQMLNENIEVPEAPEEKLSVRDRTFMDKMYSIMESRLTEGSLDIDSVAEELGVSRSKFYYKVKSLTGQTPNEFFTTYKLNYAVTLLKMDKYKISAIADMLGFSSASHFANLFKKQFGVLPSHYQN